MANTMKALQTVTVGAGGVSSVTFSNIPQTYTDLVIKLSARNSANDNACAIQFNGSTTGYSNRILYGNGSSAVSNTPGNSTIAYIEMSPETANTFANSEIYISNYASSNYKSYTSDSAQENNATTTYAVMLAGLWSNTAAITSINLGASSGSFVQYSTFTLYGVFNQDVIAAPTAPTIGTATAGIESASVAFTGVSGAASYTMTSSPGSITATGTSSPITVTGLTGGTAYTFTCTANNPIGSSAASAASNSITTLYPAYDSISTVTVGSGGSSSITFSSIPSGYTHLQLRLIGRDARAAVNDDVLIRFNSDTGANYSRHYVFADGTSVGVGGGGSATSMYFATITGANAASGLFGGIIGDILDYSNTSKNKTLRVLGGTNRNGTGEITLNSGAWYSTSAINSITIVSNSGSNFSQYTVAALYGIKAA